MNRAVAWGDLRDALRRQLATGAGRDDAIGAEIHRVTAALDALDPTPRPAAATGHPLLRHLPAAWNALQTEAPDLAALLERDGPALPWRYGYAPRPDAPGLEAAMGWAEIVGPAAPFQSDQICLGLTLIGPHHHYLPHRHPAVELYRVLTGTAAWSGPTGSGPQPPGSFILHRSNAVHAMQTGEETLLALYSWSGDILSPSVWAGETAFSPRPGSVLP